MHYGMSGEDWRFDSESLDSYDAPVPDATELTEEECRYANLPDDPRMIALLTRGGYLEIEHYDQLLESAGRIKDIKQEEIERLKSDREAALLHHSELKSWNVKYEEYVDQFKAEICLKFRRGELRAMGTRLPAPDLNQTDRILEESGQSLADLDVREIQKEQWYSKAINWEESAIYGNSESAIWIHLKTEDILKVFPPLDLLKPEFILPVGQSFALSSSVSRRDQYEQNIRGRPPLPWQDFHIEVARMFRDGQMPEKKEAAIAHIQSWFLLKIGKTVSRAAIGERLKPYFDQLVKKGQ